MVKSKYLLMCLTIWLVHAFAYGQDHRFMVFFSEKNSEFNIDNPQEFLSQRAIERRTKQGIVITAEDLPVSVTDINSLESQGVLVQYTTKWLNGALIQTDSSSLSNIMALPNVLSVELAAPGPLRPANNYVAVRTENLEQGRTQSTEIQNTLLGIDAMHQDGYMGQDIYIGVFDGGFIGVNAVSSFDHLFQNNQLITAYDYVGKSSNVYRYDDHGTKALSVIGADSPGIFQGSAPAASFILCVTEDVSSEYRIEEYNWLFAAEMADSAGVDIISTSLGYSEFDDPTMTYQPSDMNGNTTAISRAATIAASKGIVLVNSAGNEGNSAWRTITAPADVADLLAVGAITEDSIKASFSSTGPSADGRIKPDVVALGVRTAVVSGSGSVVFNNGTSFSGPQVAGLAAGIWESNPDFNYLDVLESIRQAGHLVMNTNSQMGYGIPNYLGTKELVLSVDPLPEQNFLKIYPNPVGNRLFILTEIPISYATFFIHSVEGRKYLEKQIESIPAMSELTLDLSLLPSGVYLITALTEQSAATFRLIKE